MVIRYEIIIEKGGFKLKSINSNKRCSTIILNRMMDYKLIQIIMNGKVEIIKQKTENRNFISSKGR